MLLARRKNRLYYYVVAVIMLLLPLFVAVTKLLFYLVRTKEIAIHIQHIEIKVEKACQEKLFKKNIEFNPLI